MALVAWTFQLNTAARGDDVRAIRAAELQQVTTMFSAIALQAEDKAGLHGYQTVRIKRGIT